MKICLSVILASLLLVTNSATAQIEFEFVEPEKYRDIQLTNSTKKKSIKTIKKQFNQFAAKKGEELFPDKILKIKILNIDLAGHYQPMVAGSHHDMRVVKDMEVPKIKLSYELWDKQGKLLKQGEEKLSSMSIDMSYKGKQSSLLHHELGMLQKWLKQHFATETN